VRDMRDALPDRRARYGGDDSAGQAGALHRLRAVRVGLPQRGAESGAQAGGRTAVHPSQPHADPRAARAGARQINHGQHGDAGRALEGGPAVGAWVSAHAAIVRALGVL
jgi:hypothetical protein